MKHIKYFRESIKPLSHKLREFTEEHLVDLIDDGIKVQIEINDEKSYSLFIQRFGNGFKWDDIKDHFIPFIEILNSEYNIVNNIRFGLAESSGKWIQRRWLDTNEIINDKVAERNYIVSISIDLSEK